MLLRQGSGLVPVKTAQTFGQVMFIAAQRAESLFLRVKTLFCK